MWIGGSFLIDNPKEISIDTTTGTELLRGQSYDAVQQLREEVKNKSNKDDCWTDLLGKWVSKSTIWLSDWAMEKLKVYISATSVTLECLSYLMWWALKSLNTKIFADGCRESNFYITRNFFIYITVLRRKSDKWKRDS